MPETFLILLAGGTMLAAAVSDPKAVILRWLRLAGIIALSMAGLSTFFAVRRDAISTTLGVWLAVVFIAMLGQLAFVQVAFRRTQRIFAAVAVIGSVGTGVLLLAQALDSRVTPNWFMLGCACLLSAAVSGLSLMDMLLGHAYLNAAQMTMAPLFL